MTKRIHKAEHPARLFRVSVQSCVIFLSVCVSLVTVFGNVVLLVRRGSLSSPVIAKGTSFRKQDTQIPAALRVSGARRDENIDTSLVISPIASSQLPQSDVVEQDIPLIWQADARERDDDVGDVQPASKLPDASPAAAIQATQTVDVSWQLANPNECDGYFGNGYNAFFPLVDARGETNNVVADKDMDTIFSVTDTTLLTFCRVHPAIEAAYCAMRNLIMYPDKIRLSAGGEPLDDVMGRDESLEMPVFEAGAFEVLNSAFTQHEGKFISAEGLRRGEGEPIHHAIGATGLFPNIDKRDSYKLDALRALRVVHTKSQKQAQRICTKIIKTPVIFLTRVEYANLFHTSTDWYNAWQMARVVGLTPTLEYNVEELKGLTPQMREIEKSSPREKTPRFAAHIIFLDGHNASPMDGGWLSFFLSVNYVKRFAEPTCFTSAYLAPYGYHASISQGIQPLAQQCFADPHVRQYGADFARGLGIVPRTAPSCKEAKIPVLFIRRVHYVAHPRHDGRIVRRLENEDEIYQRLQLAAIADESNFSIVNGMFSSMSMREQVQAIQDACVIMGAHGAGLSHVLAAPQGAHVFELRPPAFVRPHFISYSHWAGVSHHDWTLPDHTPQPDEVLRRLQALVLDIKAHEMGLLQ